MNKILKKFAEILLPLLIPVLRQLVETGIEEIKKKLLDNLQEESLSIQKQIRTISERTPHSWFVTLRESRFRSIGLSFIFIYVYFCILLF